jgi:hypothetical protein
MEYECEICNEPIEHGEFLDNDGLCAGCQIEHDILEAELDERT